MKYEVKDCTECKDCLSDVRYSGCEKCGTLSQEQLKNLDMLVYKNKTFTKYFFPREKKSLVYPFFVDCFFKPVKGKLLKSYKLKDATVKIVRPEGSVQPVYAIDIPSINLGFEETFSLYEKFEKRDVSADLLRTWIKEHGVLSYLFEDKNILEININPPEFEHPIRILHQEFDECITNIYPSRDFLNYLATYLKIQTGRPLNKAQPQLDGELTIGTQRGRVAAIMQPFSVYGAGYSIRKHREHPWTVPLFMQNKAVNGWFAGLMGFAVTHGRSMLIAGPRGAGKTSLLSSVILEILPKYRLITIEDTLELPISSYMQLGYDILPLKVKSALMQEGFEIAFDTGLRSSLRLGDSCLIIGEIRSTEAKVLYEAMRVGALSNVVAGTIHADSPYGVYDRVVNDLGVTKGSFKATDLIVIVNQIKNPSALSRVRRVVSVTEVLKDWDDNPKFQDLLVYNPRTDELEPTEALLKGKSVLLNDVLSKTRGYKGYKDILDDIKTRKWAKEQILQTTSLFEGALEAGNTLHLNTRFAELFDKLKPLDSSKNMEKLKKEFSASLLR